MLKFKMTEKDHVLIITVAYNRPDFIPYQYKCFQKFLTDPFTYIVYNNADNELNEMNITKTSNDIGVRCYRVPQGIHESKYPSVRCAESLNYAIMRHIVPYQGYVCIIDSDMFLIKEFSVARELKDHNIVAI